MRKYSPEEEDGKEWAAERSVACRSNPSWQAAATALTLISMPAADFDPGRENDFELLYQDASQAHGPAVNRRRSFEFDLLYPIPELVPFIGKKRNPMQRESQIPVR